METINLITKKINKTADPDYFKNYYHTSGLGCMICCPRCNRNTTRQKLLRHQKSKLCKINEANTIINLLNESPIII